MKLEQLNEILILHKHSNQKVEQEQIIRNYHFVTYLRNLLFIENFQLKKKTEITVPS